MTRCRPFLLALLVLSVGCSEKSPAAADATSGQAADSGVHFDIAAKDYKPSDAPAAAETTAGIDASAVDAQPGKDTASPDVAVAQDLMVSADVAPGDAPPPECGDGLCTGDETTDTCYVDCPVLAMCGDGACNGTENAANCLLDCPAGAPVCGDGLCQKPEGPIACSIDCDPLVLGIIACLQSKCGAAAASCMASQACYGVLGEAAQCLTNCAGSADCVDWCKTSVSKTPLAVPVVDCGFDACLGAAAGKVCGNAKCEAPETKVKCPADCHDAPKCGDGACTAPESMATCPADCKAA